MGAPRRRRVILIGPLVIVERCRIPGLVGLLFGGMVVGPNVLGVVTDPQGVVAELGAIGLLYLMFMAGLDLDLNVFAKVRRQAIAFAIMTFFGPVRARVRARHDRRLRGRRRGAARVGVRLPHARHLPDDPQLRAVHQPGSRRSRSARP